MHTRISREDDYEGWLRARSSRITSSDASHLMRTAHPRWRLDFPALKARKEETSGWIPKCIVLAGNNNEAGIISLTEAYLSVSIAPNDALHLSPQLGGKVAATPDGFLKGPPTRRPDLDDLEKHLFLFGAEGEEFTWEEFRAHMAERCGLGPVLVETKCQKSRNRSKWRKPAEPPPHYDSQCRHHMLAMGAPTCLLIARVDETELYVHVLHRDEDYEDLFMLPAYEEFLAYLES